MIRGKYTRGFTFIEMVVSITIITLIVFSVSAILDKMYKQITNQ